jgi:hypothetical protein
MQIRISNLAAASVVAVLASCAAPPPPPAPPAPLVSFDGHYSGSIQLSGQASASKGTNWCTIGSGMAVTVSHNSFSYVLGHPNLAQAPTLTFEATIGQDGGFNVITVNGDASMVGRATASRIDGTIAGSFCTYTFALYRS